MAGVEGLEKVKKPLKPHQCKRYLQVTVAEAYRDIVKGFVKEAMAGGVPHLKMATEIVESKTRVKQAAGRAKSPAELLMEELRREVS